MKKKLVIFQIRSDKFKEIGMQMENSLKYFHPDIPFIVFNQQKIDEAQKERPNFMKLYGYPYIGLKLSKEYEMVIQMDADSIICGKLDELLNIDQQYDLACVQNNSSRGFQNTYGDIPIDEYVNAGLVASRSEVFWYEWLDRCEKESKGKYFGEQDVLNIIIHSKKYKLLMLDGDNTNVYYGCSSFNSYSSMSLVGEDIILNEKKVKIIHTAGDMNNKLKVFNTNEQVADRIKFLLSSH